MFRFVLLLFLLTSCTSNTIYKKPTNLIPKDTMVSLLTDMYIASSAKYIKNTFSKSDVNYMPLVYEKYTIDSMRFTKSNIYYTSKDEDYNEILKEVEKRLKKLQQEYEKKVRLQDSLKTAKEKDSTAKNISTHIQE